MRPHVANERLTSATVPPADAPWRDVAAFGHSFHAYKVVGSLQRVAAVTVETHAHWEATGELPRDLTRLRVCLFHTVRAVGLDDVPDPDTEAWARALVRAVGDEIAEAAGGGAGDARR